MTNIIFKIDYDLHKNRKNISIIFDFVNPFTNCQINRKLFFTKDNRYDKFKNDIEPYITFLISHKLLNEYMLTLYQDKLLGYIVYKYIKNYPHTKLNSPPGISKYFRRVQYDRHCLGKNSEETITNIASDASKYPNRLLAPQNTGVTTLIVGSSFTGKTHLLSNEINLLKPYEYDLIILFTESANVPILDDIKKRPDILIKEGFDKEIPEFLKKLNSYLKLRYRFLLILDDIIDQKSNRKSILGKMLTTYRNSNISTCVLAQFPTIIEKESRANFHQVVITGMRSIESNKSLTDRFDLIGWAKKRMQQEGFNHNIKLDEVHSYLQKLLTPNGIVLYIDMKKSLEPSVIDTNL
jgi:hypothetical protein